MQRVDIASIDLPIAAQDEKCFQIDEYLDRLSKEDPDKADVVKLRVFTGLKVSEIAFILDCSEKTVQRHWNFARAVISVAEVSVIKNFRIRVRF